MKRAGAWTVCQLFCELLDHKRSGEVRTSWSLWVGSKRPCRAMCRKKNSFMRGECTMKVAFIVIMHAHDTSGSLPHLWQARCAERLQALPRSCQEGGLRQRHPGRG